MIPTILPGLFVKIPPFTEQPFGFSCYRTEPLVGVLRYILLSKKYHPARPIRLYSWGVGKPYRNPTTPYKEKFNIIKRIWE